MATLTKNYQKIGTGSAQSFGYATGYLEIWAKYNSQSIANNTTNYSVQLRLVVSSGYIGNYQATNYSLSSTGLTTSSGNLGSGDYTSRTITTITGNVTHNGDGKKSINSSGSINFTAWGQTLSVSGSATLPTIPRTSGVACSSPFIGDTATITIDRKSSLFTDTITYKIGSLSGTVAEKTSNTVLSLDTSSIADEIYALIPNSKEIEGKIICETYSGNTKIGTSEAKFNLYAKENVAKPTVSGTIVDTNERTIALTGSANKFIKYVSQPKVTVNATANKSATIKSYSINLNDGQTQNVQEYTFPKISSNKVTVNAIDSRGYGNPQDIDLTDKMIDYVELHIDKIALKRTEEASNEIIMNLNGVWYNGDFSSTKSNTLNASYQYKATEDQGWTEGGTLLPVIDGNTFKITNLSLGTEFDYQKEYQFQVYFTDELMTIGGNVADVIVVPKGQEVVAIGEDGVWVYGKLWLNDQIVGSGTGSSANVLNSFSDSEYDVYSCNYINKTNTYSFDEEVIGAWLGKPLYRKVVYSTNSLNSSTPLTMNIGVANMDSVFVEKAFMFNNNGTVSGGNRLCYPLPFNYAPNENSRICLRLNSDNIELTSTGSWSSLWTKVVIVNYTKTTD